LHDAALYWQRRRPEKIFVYLDSTPVRNSVTQRRSSQRGEGKFRAIVFTVVLVVGIFLAFKLVPPYVAEYQLQDKMQEMARFGIVNHYSEEQIRDNMFKVVQDLDIQGVKREDIKVSVSQSLVKVSLEYAVPVDLLLYSTELHFSPSSENKSIM
jgi:hypothetical protein